MAQVDPRDMLNNFVFMSRLKNHCLPQQPHPLPVSLDVIELVPS